MSGDTEGKIRCWRMEDGGEDSGMPMDAGSGLFNVAVSRDGRLVVSGTETALVRVWNVETHSRVSEFGTEHSMGVLAVDISPDATKIVTGSQDKTACVWSLSTGRRLLGPWEHNNFVVAAKFSPDGRFIATATWNCDSVRIYDSQNDIFVQFPVKVNWILNYSLTWVSDSKQLFAISHDGDIHRVDVSTRSTLSTWHIHGSAPPTCIALACNETFIAASAYCSVSFWDTRSQEQIGTVIEYTHEVWSMVISSNYDLVTGGDKIITLRALRDILPSDYLDNVSAPA